MNNNNMSTRRGTIRVSPGTLHLVASEAEDAIIRAGFPVYQRGRKLVRPACQEVTASHGRRTVSACFSELTTPAMLDYLSRSADWTRYDRRAKADAVTDPPARIADIVLSRFGEWQFPQVVGVITTPTLRPDLSILCEPGYDPVTRLYLVDALRLPPIAAAPTRDDALASLKLLDDLLPGFPFVTDVDRSVALSALMTPVCRGAMTAAPLHGFRASTAGTGKSFLCDVASAIATGQPCPVSAAGRDGDETDKRLVGLLLAGLPLVSIDNVNGEIGSDLLCQAVERPALRIRALGKSDTFEIESRATIFANGNAMRVRGDLTRRTLFCDLDAQEERPELRTFAFDPVKRVLDDRAKYVAAVLTIVQAFATSGDTPAMDPLASYDDYCRTVRGALVWLDQPDPVDSMESVRSEDPELGELRAVMEQWALHIGVDGEAPAKTLLTLAEAREMDPDTGRPLPEFKNPDLLDLLLAVAGERGRIDSRRFGNWLRNKQGRVVGMKIGDAATRLRFEMAGASKGINRWRLASVVKQQEEAIPW